MTETRAIEMLRAYNIVRGDTTGNLGLDDRLTRAQAAALFVRALGIAELAPSVADQVPFSDAVGHWGAGEITLASRMNLMRGDGNGTFRPNSDITYAEIMTVLLRIVQREPAGPWNPDTIMGAAQQLGMAPEGVAASAPAIRRKIFWSLAVTVANVQLPTGESPLRKYLDQVPPELTVDQAIFTTTDATITVSGIARGAEKVTVAGSPAAYSATTGRFTATASLTVGKNVLLVEAVDYAGNKSTAVVQAERQTPVSRLEVFGPKTVRAGTSITLTVKGFDSSGRETPVHDLQAQLSNDLASFDVNTMKLTAGTRLGRSVLTLKTGRISATYAFEITNLSARASALRFAPMNSGRALGLDKEATVQVQVLDAAGAVVTDDYYREITLAASDLAGVTIETPKVATVAGVATFTVIGSTQGAMTLRALSTGFDEVTMTVQVLSSPRVTLTATPATILPDGSATARIQARLEDDQGRAVANNSGTPIRVLLVATGTDGEITDAAITIPAGYSTSSGDDAYFKAGLTSGSVSITGYMSSSHTFSIQHLTLPVQGSNPPVRLQVVAPTTSQRPGGSPVAVTVQVIDAQNRVVTWGSFAFRLQVAIDNQTPLASGLPDGVTLTLGNTPYQPIFGTGEYAVSGRTHLGQATVMLSYDKSGVVTLIPRPISATGEAFHSAILMGPAAGTTGLATAPASVTFAGTPTSIELTVDSQLGKDRPGGALNANGSMVVRAKVLDSNGFPIPTYTGTIILTRSTTGDKVTSLSGTTLDYLRKNATNGVAEFVIAATNNPGFDVYTASATSVAPASVTVAVRKQKTMPPTIVAVRGASESDLAPVVGYAAPDAQYVDIQLEPLFSPYTNEPTYYALATVYRKGQSTALGTPTVINMASSLPIIRIPKALVPAGLSTFEVVLNDGGGASDRSPDLGLSTLLNAVYNVNYRLSSALYDAATTNLTFSTSGLTATGTVDPAKIAFDKDGTRLPLGAQAVMVKSISASAVVLTLNDLAGQLHPAVFNGNVSVVAEDGWYQAPDGYQVAKGATVAVRPLANISYATLDVANRRLLISGSGFTKGTLALDKIRVGDTNLRPGSTTTYDRAAVNSDGLITVTLSQTTFDALMAEPGPSTAITAAAGWLFVESGGQHRAPALEGGDRTMLVQIPISSAPYARSNNTLTIKGAGYTGATLDPTKLVFKLPSGVNVRRLTDATATTVDDNSITVKLSDADATFFESTSGYGGRQVILNTDPGWLTDAQGRLASPIPTNSVVFTVPAQ